jgi:hypothetical protein
MIKIFVRIGLSIQEPVVAACSHATKSFGPAFTRPPVGANDDLLAINLELDFFSQSRLREQGPGDAKTARIVDFNSFCYQLYNVLVRKKILAE